MRYLARVVHTIGDGERVMILGAAPMKLALERVFVAINHEPDRLIAIPATMRPIGPEVLERFERLAA